MTQTAPVKHYLDRIKRNLATGQATEHTHRAALATLLESLGEGVKAINEPTRIACGAPDLAVLKDGFMVGHVEAKDVSVPLDTAERSEQLTRYRQSLENLILTDYVELRWYVDGDLRRTVRLARVDAHGQLKTEKGGEKNVADLLTDFLAHTPEPIGTPRDLAERMARLTHLIREIIVTAFETERASDLLVDWRKAFAEVLVADLDQPDHVEQFADMFAQTLAYGLFSARIRYEKGDFTRQQAQYLIPRTNPFLRDFFTYITGPQLDDEPYAGLVEDLVQVLALSDMGAILEDFGRRTRQDDPTVHFYETFLAAYDPGLRERRGVFYTPNPIVSFIVRSVDILLKEKFGLHGGLADTTKLPNGTHQVLILDPAVGTATFPYHVIDLIRGDFMARNNAGMWSGYVREHLLPRIFGFELLMAPYAVAHFKLALQLGGHDLPEELQAQWAYDFAADERLQIYLTNALETTSREPPTFWGPLKIVAEEAARASEVKKELPIMVVIGNPPYSGHSANDNLWIDGLLKGKLPDGTKVRSYYEVDGHPLRERVTKWLQDDYVKFIRFGQWRIEQSGSGVLAYVSNNGYLENPTFKGMRQSLMEAFSEIYILNLHGSARTRETAPDGSPDENVFDIMQGVAIGIFVKKQGQTSTAQVYYADLWGSRIGKYEQLSTTDTSTTDWSQVNPEAPFYLFVPRSAELKGEYREGWQITKTFPLTRMGVTSGDDSFAYDWSSMSFKEKIEGILTTGKWDKKTQVREKILANLSISHLDCIHDATYRPFDQRKFIFSSEVVWRPVEDLGCHFVRRNNLGLITIRRSRTGETSNFFVTNAITDKSVISSVDNAHVSPLYLYPEEAATKLFDDTATSPWPPDPAHGDRVPNLSRDFVEEFATKLDLPFDPHKTGNAPGPAFGPEDVLAYAYAIFHSPTYRERYAEFLKIDFPRVPLTSDAALFWDLVSLGSELVALHLMEHPQLHQTITSYPVAGDDQVKPRGGYPKYTPPNAEKGTPGRVWINKEQYIEGVPEDVWEFQVGGYQVLHKWLKDRRGRKLSYDELNHYQRIVVALRETMRLMAEVDAAIPSWPVE